MSVFNNIKNISKNKKILTGINDKLTDAEIYTKIKNYKKIEAVMVYENNIYIIHFYNLLRKNCDVLLVALNDWKIKKIMTNKDADEAKQYRNIRGCYEYKENVTKLINVLIKNKINANVIPLLIFSPNVNSLSLKNQNEVIKIENGDEIFGINFIKYDNDIKSIITEISSKYENKNPDNLDKIDKILTQNK